MQLCFYFLQHTAMASFSPKNYFKKIQTPEVLTKFYGDNGIQAFFEINEQTPRKRAVEIMLDFYLSLSPEEKYDIERELALIDSLSTKYAPDIFAKILKQNGAKNTEMLIECVTDHDKVLYYYTHHRDIVEDVFFINDFYKTKGYMLYEAKEVALDKVEMEIGECTREFKRIANKEDRATELDIETKTLDGIFYLFGTFEGSPLLTPTKNKDTGEIDRKKTTRKIEQIRIVYLPADKEVLISYTGSKQEKVLFLDTFLRVMGAGGYDDKVQSFDISVFKDEVFDFTKWNKGVPLLNWKIKSIALSVGEGKLKKKLRMTLPSSAQEFNLLPLFSTIDELAISKAFESCTVESVALAITFSKIGNSEKSVRVGCTVSPTKSSLSPLLPYDRYARTLLKQSGIDKGFVEKAVKEKDDAIKKWEV
jgi:hypothetical protein